MDDWMFWAAGIVLVVGWLINIPIETRLRGRTPKGMEVFVSFLLLSVALIGLYFLDKNWDKLKAENYDLEKLAALGGVALGGALLATFHTYKVKGVAWQDVPVYEAVVALLLAFIAFCGFWAELDAETTAAAVPLAFASGYGSKALTSEKKETSQAEDGDGRKPEGGDRPSK